MWSWFIVTNSNSANPCFQNKRINCCEDIFSNNVLYSHHSSCVMYWLYFKTPTGLGYKQTLFMTEFFRMKLWEWGGGLKHLSGSKKYTYISMKAVWFHTGKESPVCWDAEQHSNELAGVTEWSIEWWSDEEARDLATTGFSHDQLNNTRVGVGRNLWAPDQHKKMSGSQTTV